MLRAPLLLALLLAVLLSCAEPPAPLQPLTDRSSWAVSASSVQEPGLEAEKACDGDLKSRWSSLAADPQQLTIDFGRTVSLAGVTLHWEAAFASQYAIALSADGQTWREVYATDRGNGGTDLVLFPRADARYLRLDGQARATGWGYSLWEIEPRGAVDAPVLTVNGRPIEDWGTLFDGSTDTAWNCPLPGELVIDLRRDVELGGVRLDWGDAAPAAATLELSSDSRTWRPAGEEKEAGGPFDVILCSRQSARFVRLRLSGTAGSAAIRELSFRGPDETLSPLALYELAAQKAAPGLYPDQLRKRQVYWTVMGVPDDHRESLLDEYGNLEPVAKGVTLMPYVFANGRLSSALDATAVTQRLADDCLPLPGVAWDLGGLALDVEAFAWGAARRSGTFACYTLVNRSKAERSGTLYLAVRPVQINPSWQYGGLTAVKSLALEQGAGILVNGALRFWSYEAPTGWGCRAFDRGDIARELVRDTLPPRAALRDSGEQISGALAFAFRLAPGESRALVVGAPLYDDTRVLAEFAGASFAARRAEMRSLWRAQLAGPVLELPDTELTNTIRSQLAYMLVNRDSFAIQPGSRQYERSWIRDGAMMGETLLYFGLDRQVREFIAWYAHYLTPEGKVPPSFHVNDPLDAGPGSGIEWDGQGAYVTLIMDYYRFTGDKAFLRRYYPSLMKSLRFLVSLREQTLAPGYRAGEPVRERYVGILPKSFSHEGYYPEMHSYWDDFWALKGWKDGAAAAEVLGRKEDAAWARAQYALLRDSVARSIRLTIAHHRIGYIPGCAEKGDFDPTSTAIAFHPCDEDEILDSAVLLATFERYWQDILARRNPEWKSGFTPYEARNLTALVELGQEDRADELLRYFMDCRRPAAWNHLAEVVLGDYRAGCYIGDMPHTWVGSSLLNAVRLMLLREDDGALRLLDGAPARWLADGGVTLRRMPTWYGAIDLAARSDGSRLTVTIAGPVKPPRGFVLFWPAGFKPARVLVDGAACADHDARACRLPATAREVIAER